MFKLNEIICYGWFFDFCKVIKWIIGICFWIRNMVGMYIIYMWVLNEWKLYNFYVSDWLGC